MQPHASPRIESCIEALCQKGCRAVWGDIARLERGDVPAETAGLNPDEREQVLIELRALMSVYAERCSIEEPPADPPFSPSD